ncbi:MAG TPA: hypothetical protein VFN07_11500 [Trueperaceae bacterium]|nr:hypothetical protein [Trueperaceae bacterium]
MVEFLNDQIGPAEVLAVEVRQYLGENEGVQTLVPRLLGQTAKARRRKGPDSSAAHVEWNEDLLLTSMSEHAGPQAAGLARELFDWARLSGLIVRFGLGAKVGGAYLELPVDSGVVRIAGISMRGRHSVALNALDEFEPFSYEGARDNLIARYERLKGFTIPANRRRQMPEFDLSLLLAVDSKVHFFAAVEFHVEELRAGHTAARAAVHAP